MIPEMLKREISATFRRRLQALLDRSEKGVSAFARDCGLDRSAFSQFLDGKNHRLPRAETLHSIANGQGVSVDWLLGLSQDEDTIAAVASIESVESGASGTQDSPLAQWHAEAEGYKIRYSPSSLPDSLRTRAVTEYEFGQQVYQDVEIKRDQSESQLAYSRLPETDIEVVMPLQRLQNLATGTDIWRNLARGARQAQLDHMAVLLDELYPTFRLFLYDGLTHYCGPFTVFGPIRAAVYVGDRYLVINSTEQIRELSAQFDRMIRVAVIGPDKAAEFVGDLQVT